MKYLIIILIHFILISDIIVKVYSDLINNSNSKRELDVFFEHNCNEKYCEYEILPDFNPEDVTLDCGLLCYMKVKIPMGDIVIDVSIFLIFRLKILILLELVIV